MANTKETLKSLMKEANLSSKVQHELLRCVESGKCFPYIPKTFIESKRKRNESEISDLSTPGMRKFPSRPIQRPKSTIEKLGDYERDKFRPSPSQTRPPYEKERLQNLMAYGKDIDEEIRNIKFEEILIEEKEPEVDMFSEILREIKERKEFLDDMRALGEEKKYLPEIMCEISLRLRELEKIDKDRAQIYVQQYRL